MIRNYLFSMFFFGGIIFISLIFLPALLLPKQVTLIGGKLMGYWTGFCLKIFLSVKISVKGRENIINDKKFFIASSHQSMFETFYLQIISSSAIREICIEQTETANKKSNTKSRSETVSMELLVGLLKPSFFVV